MVLSEYINPLGTQVFINEEGRSNRLPEDLSSSRVEWLLLCTMLESENPKLAHVLLLLTLNFGKWILSHIFPISKLRPTPYMQSEGVEGDGLRKALPILPPCILTLRARSTWNPEPCEVPHTLILWHLSRYLGGLCFPNCPSVLVSLASSLI